MSDSHLRPSLVKRVCGRWYSTSCRSSGLVIGYYLTMSAMLIAIGALELKSERESGQTENPLVFLAMFCLSTMLWRILGRSCRLGHGDRILVRGFWHTYVVPWTDVHAIFFVDAEWRTREFNWSWVVVHFEDRQEAMHSVVVSANGSIAVSHRKACSLAGEAPVQVDACAHVRPLPGPSEFVHAYRRFLPRAR